MVETEDARTSPGGIQAGDSRRASLQLELRVPDKQMLVTFRDAFLRWLTDRTGPFDRVIGCGERLSLDEQPPTSDAHGMSTLRLTVTWSLATSAARVRTNSLRAVGEPRTNLARRKPTDSFVFVPYPPLADAPLHPEVPGAATESAPEPYLRRPRRRREKPIGVRIGRGVAMAMNAARASAQQLLGGLRTGGLTVRVPTLATHPRIWTLGLLGSAAVATGFVAGSIYLGTPHRPAIAGAPTPRAAEVQTSAPASTSAAQAAPAPVAAVAAPAAVAQPVVASADPRSQEASPPPRPVERRASASDRAGSTTRQEPPIEQTVQAAQTAPVAELATTGTASIPGDETITSAPLPDGAAGRPAGARPAPIAVVRAADGGTDSAGSNPAGVRGRVKGTLLVKSDPQGAEVSINGIVHGRTPLMIRDLGAGSRVVRLELPGYERWSWAVAVVANKRTPVNVKLRPESRGVSNPN
jgi:hypothetical protein